MLAKSLTAEVLEDVMSLKPRRIAFATRLLLLALIIPLAACSKSDKAFGQSVCFSRRRG